MIEVGSRIRWRGLIGHEGTVVQLGADGRWAWVEYVLAQGGVPEGLALRQAML
jgi:hypothetical protein